MVIVFASTFPKNTEKTFEVGSTCIAKNAYENTIYRNVEANNQKTTSRIHNILVNILKTIFGKLYDILE